MKTKDEKMLEGFPEKKPEKASAKYKKSSSSKDIMAMSEEVLELPKEIADMIGEFSLGSSILIFGPSGSGKSTLGIHLMRAFKEHGKCYWNEVEQANKKKFRPSFKLMLRREEMDNEPMSKVSWGKADLFDEMVAKLKRNQARFIFMNSLQYLKFDECQWKMLQEKYPMKSFIIIGHGDMKPDGQVAKAIHYDVDVKIRVFEGQAFPDSRLGGNKPYRIFHKDRGEAEKPKGKKLNAHQEQLVMEYNKSIGKV